MSHQKLRLSSQLGRIRKVSLSRFGFLVGSVSIICLLSVTNGQAAQGIDSKSVPLAEKPSDRVQFQAWGGVVRWSLDATLAGGSWPDEVAAALVGNRDLSSGLGRQSLERAIAAFGDGLSEQVLEHLQSAVSAEPSYPAAPLMLARLYLANRQSAEARKILESYAAEQTGSVDLHVTFALVALAETRRADAEVHLDKVEWILDQTQTQSAATFRGSTAKLRARIAVARGQNEVAAAHLQTALELEPEDSNLLYRLGVLQFKAGRQTEALATLQESFRMHSSHDPAELTLAMLCFQDLNAPQGHHWLGQALLQHPQNAKVLEYACYLALMSHQPQAALEYGQKWMQVQPDSVPAIVASAVAARHLADEEMAQKLLIQLLSLHPEEQDAIRLFALQQLAVMLADSADSASRREGLRYAQQLVASQPTLVQRVTLAWVQTKALERDNQPARTDLIAAYERLFESGYQTAELVFQYAQLLLQEQSHERCKSVIDQLLASGQPFPGRMTAEYMQLRLSAHNIPQNSSGTPED